MGCFKIAGFFFFLQEKKKNEKKIIDISLSLN